MVRLESWILRLILLAAFLFCAVAFFGESHSVPGNVEIALMLTILFLTALLAFKVSRR